LIYLAVDNDLEGVAFEDLDEMMTVGPTEEVNLVVQADWAPGVYGRPEHWRIGDFVSTQRLLIKPGEMEVLANLGEQDSSSPEVLADFISWGATEYPARRYALVLADHGLAFGGFGYDYSSDSSHTSIAQLVEGLEEGISLAGPLLAEGFDLIAFDACLMANYLVAYRMAPFGHYLLASEEVVPGSGLDYAALGTLLSGPRVDAKDLAVALAKASSDVWLDVWNDATVSVVDLGQMPALDQALASLTGALIEDLDSAIEPVMTARFLAQQLQPAPYEFLSTQFIDLGDFVSRLSSLAPEYEVQTEAFLKAFSAAVVYNRFGPAVPGATGLTIFFPSSKHYYDAVNPLLGEVAGEVYEAAGPPASWFAFLQEWFAAVEPKHMGPEFSCEGLGQEQCDDGVAFIEEGTRTVTVYRDLDLQTVPYGAHVQLAFGYQWPSGAGPTEDMDIFHRRPASFDPATGRVEGTFDLRRLILRQGDISAEAYWTLQPTPAGRKVAIPLFHYSPDSDLRSVLIWKVLLAPDEDTVLHSAYYHHVGGSAQEVAAPPDGILQAQAYWHGVSWSWFTYYPKPPEFDAAEPLELEFQPLPPGKTGTLWLEATDRLGRAAVAAAKFEP